MGAIEQEIGKLETEMLSGVYQQLRAVMKQLVELSMAVSHAQRVLKEQNLTKTGGALQKVLSEIVCEFEFEMKGSQRQSHCKRVRFVPIFGDDMVMDIRLSDRAQPTPC